MTFCLVAGASAASQLHQNFLMDKKEKKDQTVSELKSCVLCTENIWACERACQRARVLNMLHVTLNILAVTLLSGGCGRVTSTAERAHICVLFKQVTMSKQNIGHHTQAEDLTNITFISACILYKNACGCVHAVPI